MCEIKTHSVKCAEAVNEISPEGQQVMRGFPKLFKRKGRVKITKKNRQERECQNYAAERS